MIRLKEFPDDILEDIFHAMRDLICFPGEHTYLEPIGQSDNGIDAAGPRRKRTVPLWANIIVLSHVCAHWRSLMLTRPRLWTFIRVTGSFANRVMVNEMLERSGTFPLSVLITNSSLATIAEAATSIFDLLGVTSTISDHSKRIRELGVILQFGHAGFVLNAFNAGVPQLEKLWIDSGMPGNADPQPITISQLGTPPVRVLHAHGIPFRWLPFKNLVRLELTSGPSPPLPELLHTIYHSPLLELLRLCIMSDEDEEDEDEPDGQVDEVDYFPPYEGHEADRAADADAGSDDSDSEMEIMDGPAPLPYLRRLDLRVNPFYSGAFAVLPHIDFPHTTRTSLSFARRASPTPLTSSCPPLSALASAVSRATLVLNGGRAGQNWATLSSSSSSSGPPLSIEYQFAQRELTDRELFVISGSSLATGRLWEGFLAVPLPALTVLSLAILVDPDAPDAADLSPGRFVGLFKEVPALTRLAVDVYAEHAEALFIALGSAVGSDSDRGGEGDEDGHAMEAEEGKRAVVCPQLEELAVAWLDEPRVDDFWSLERCCHSRCAAGSRIQRLETYAFPPIVLGSLQKSVETIVVVDA